MRRANVVFRSVLALLAAANLYGLQLGLRSRADLVAQWPRLDSVWPLYLACPVVTLIALAALLRRKRWGFWLAVGVAALVLAIEVYAAGLAPHVFRVPIATAILVAATVPVWRELS